MAQSATSCELSPGSCGFAPKIYRQKKYRGSDPRKKGVNPISTGTNQSIRAMRIPSEALDCWREKNRAARCTLRRLLLVAQGSRSSATEIFVIEFVRMCRVGRVNADRCRWALWVELDWQSLSPYHAQSLRLEERSDEAAKGRSKSTHKSINTSNSPYPALSTCLTRKRMGG